MKKFVCSAAAILAASSVMSAQPMPASKQAPCCFEQGYEICNDKYPAAYNAPARIDVQCSWDIFATASFIYWHVDQEAMELAVPAITDVVTLMQGEYLVQDFDYKPGFKVGLGVNFGHDNWVGFVEYTWLHQTTDTGTSTVPSDADYWNVASWFNDPLEPTTVGSKWRMNMDLLDATLSRPFYQGRKLIILPFGGLRGAWIRQNMKVQAVVPPAGEQIPAENMLSRNHSHNWAVGPRAGLKAHWLLGCGFRFEGDAAASLLYTRFTKVTHVESVNGVTGAFSSFKDYGTVRPMADMGVGIGWGSYFDRQNYHFDLLATYDFNVMWGQNMLPKASSVAAIYGDNSEAADLHLHGLTVTARFDF